MSKGTAWGVLLRIVIVRANALEDNFRLYHVVNGRRVQFAGTNFKVTSQQWHEIKVEPRGDEFKCAPHWLLLLQCAARLTREYEAVVAKQSAS
jgi:hypothetical protein